MLGRLHRKILVSESQRSERNLAGLETEVSNRDARQKLVQRDQSVLALPSLPKRQDHKHSERYDQQDFKSR